AELAQLADQPAVDVGLDAAREAAGDHAQLRAAREVEQLVAEQLHLALGDGGTALVDLRLHAGRRVEHGGVRARFLADADEVGQHRLGRERVDDARAGRAAGEAGGDHGAPEQLDLARDVDALPAGHRRLRDRAMAAADAEVRHLERLVDRRVEGDRDDHDAVSISTRRRPLCRATRVRTTTTTTTPRPATTAL